MIAKVYAELASSGKKVERRDAAERLFALNRGALLQNGIRLPVELRINVAGRIERILKGAVRAAGMEPVRNSPRYTLTLDSAGEGFVFCELYDGGRGITLFRQNLPLPSAIPPLTGSPQKAAFARTLRDGIFEAF